MLDSLRSILVWEAYVCGAIIGGMAGYDASCVVDTLETLTRLA